ncbi:hypothetical protein MPER_11121 [Moniliophthora perniciosa FA553]|nr:hypothetical protein MPER_11121 [Moniliophthora perniciosa FA553]
MFGAETATQTQDSRFEEIVEDETQQFTTHEGADASVPWWKVASIQQQLCTNI